MTDFNLIPHPRSPPKTVNYVNVQVVRTRNTLELCYVSEGPTDRLALPAPANPYRTDELWRTTCFELFVSTGQGTYLEFNFAPSSQWAGYRFSSYRGGMQPVAVNDPPVVRVSDKGYALIVAVVLDWPEDAAGTFGLSAVIEEIDGTKSYWALAHAPGPPDFHNPDCFIATLPAPQRA